jgi:hypothetical protein
MSSCGFESLNRQEESVNSRQNKNVLPRWLRLSKPTPTKLEFFDKRLYHYEDFY